MPSANSYLVFTANGSTTKFALTGIDGWLNSGFLEVYLNNVLQTTGYTLITESGVDKIQFATAPANQTIVIIKRNTPNTVASFKNEVVDFNDGSVLTAAALDRAVEALVHISQETEDGTGSAMGLTVDQTTWDAESKRISNMADGLNANDAVSMGQFSAATLFGGAVVVPQVWSFTASGVGPYTLNPAPLNTDSRMFIVENGGVIVPPSDYVVDSTSIQFITSKTGATSVRNFGVARNLIASTAVLDNNAVTTAKIIDNAVTFAKMQDLNAYQVIGSTTAGDPTQIPCSAAAQALLAQSSNSAIRSTLGLGTLATVSVIEDSALIGKQVIIADKMAASSVATAALQSQAVTSAKIENLGPHWDATKVWTGRNTTPATGSVPYVDFNASGNVTVQPGGTSGSAYVWSGYSASATPTVTTTIRADGAAVASTDLITKGVLDALPLYNLDRQDITPTNVLTNGLRVEIPVNSIDTRRLARVNWLNQVFPYVSGTGTHYIALRNNGATSVKVMVLYGEFTWEGWNGSSASAANAASPDNFNLPWSAGASLGSFSEGVTTISAGGIAYFQGTGLGWTAPSANTTTSNNIFGTAQCRVSVRLWVLRLN